MNDSLTTTSRMIGGPAFVLTSSVAPWTVPVAPEPIRELRTSVIHLSREYEDFNLFGSCASDSIRKKDPGDGEL